LAMSRRWASPRRTCLSTLEAPSTISVVTFGDDVDSGKAARLLYERMGFARAKLAPASGPEGRGAGFIGGVQKSIVSLDSCRISTRTSWPTGVP
jgi:hypothetical protein